MISISLQRHIWKNVKLVRNITSSPNIFSKEDDGTGGNKNSNDDEVTKKLNDLLNKMIQEKDVTPLKPLKVAQAVKRKKEKIEKDLPLGKKLEKAAKEVAKTFGGDIEKTESELIQILLRRSEPSSQALKDVLANMKVDKTDPEPAVSKAQQVRESLTQHKPVEYTKEKAEFFKTTRRQTETSEYVDIMGATPSTYFNGMKPQPPSCRLEIWNSCLNRDMRLATTHPPANIYEQMIQWTEKGMLWNFPIDNFQGLEEEKQVPFEEHVILDQHLEDWCPDNGPIRQFMELVCLGLSKNYWLTVEEKKQHIFWYRDYFADKKKLIKELGAGDILIELDEKKDLFESVIHRPQD